MIYQDRQDAITHRIRYVEEGRSEVYDLKKNAPLNPQLDGILEWWQLLRERVR